MVPSWSLNPAFLPLEYGWRRSSVMGWGGVQGIVVLNLFSLATARGCAVSEVDQMAWSPALEWVWGCSTPH